MVGLVETMLKLNKDLPKAKPPYGEAPRISQTPCADAESNCEVQDIPQCMAT